MLLSPGGRGLGRWRCVRVGRELITSRTDPTTAPGPGMLTAFRALVFFATRAGHRRTYMAVHLGDHAAALRAPVGVSAEPAGAPIGVAAAAAAAVAAAAALYLLTAVSGRQSLLFLVGVAAGIVLYH